MQAIPFKKYLAYPSTVSYLIFMVWKYHVHLTMKTDTEPVSSAV